MKASILLAPIMALTVILNSGCEKPATCTLPTDLIVNDLNFEGNVFYTVDKNIFRFSENGTPYIKMNDNNSFGRINAVTLKDDQWITNSMTTGPFSSTVGSGLLTPTSTGMSFFYRNKWANEASLSVKVSSELSDKSFSIETVANNLDPDYYPVYSTFSPEFDMSILINYDANVGYEVYEFGPEGSTVTKMNNSLFSSVVTAGFDSDGIPYVVVKRYDNNADKYDIEIYKRNGGSWIKKATLVNNAHSVTNTNTAKTLVTSGKAHISIGYATTYNGNSSAELYIVDVDTNQVVSQFSIQDQFEDTNSANLFIKSAFNKDGSLGKVITYYSTEDAGFKSDMTYNSNLNNYTLTQFTELKPQIPITHIPQIQYNKCDDLVLMYEYYSNQEGSDVFTFEEI